MQIAAAAFSPSELMAIKRLGDIDTIVVKASQPGLNPDSPAYDPEYLAYVMGMIQGVRAASFTVIVALVAQPQSGSPNEGKMPTDATVAAWQKLAPALADDNGVIIEPYNEPATPGCPSPPESSDWQAWQSASNRLVSLIRATGAKNTILIDGNCWGEALNSAYQVTDPAQNLGYGVHPYWVVSDNTPEKWQKNWGAACQTLGVCVVTEWMVASGTSYSGLIGCGYIAGDAMTLVAEFFSYLESRRIGLIGWAYDYPDTIMIGQGQTENDLTSLSGWVDCHHTPSPWGAGQALIKEFNSGRWR